MRHALLPLIALTMFLLSPLPATAAPQVKTTERDFDFGRIFQGEKVHHTFQFANEGDAPLHVSKVRTSCGCTAALLSARVIAPGESGEISVTFDSTRFRGHIKKTVYLHTDDPKQSVTTFTLQGTVDQEISFRPERLTLGQVPAGQAAKGEITLANHGKKEIGMKIDRISIPEMSVQLEDSSLPPGSSTQVHVEVTPKTGQKRLNGWIILGTDSPSIPQIRIPVLVSVEQQ